MEEIGGYFELEKFSGEHYHNNSIPLNCGRGCIKYLIKLRKITGIRIPNYMCNSVVDSFKNSGVKVGFYNISKEFRPIYDFELEDEEWLYINDYYGQLNTDDIRYAKSVARGRIICDETHGFYNEPCEGVDTFYSCRKWFGVADGAYLVTKDGRELEDNIEIDVSYNRMTHVLGRFEKNASLFYECSVNNNAFFDNEPEKRMSLITENLLKAIDYKRIAEKRNNNWEFVNRRLIDRNLLKPIKPYVPFMYPFLISDSKWIRERLSKKRIYIPVLWPGITKGIDKNQTSYYYSNNILPIPIDQRYNREQLDYLCEIVLSML